MYLITVFISLLVIKIDLCHSAKNRHEVVLYRKSILKDYDKHESPIPLTTSLPVNLSVHFHDFHIDADDGFTFSGNIVMGWNDQRLKWDQAKNMNKSVIILSSKDIWQAIPAVVATVKFNVVYNDVISTEREVFTISTPKGRLTTYYNFQFHLNNGCISDYKNWPYDLINCSISIGFPFELEQNITIAPFRWFKSSDSSEGYVSVYSSSKNRDWMVYKSTDFKRQRNESSSNEEQLVINVQFKRNGSRFGTLLFQPCFVTLGLALVLFWMDPRSPERIVLIGSILTIQCILFASMTVFLPRYGTESLFVVFLCSISFSINIILLMVTIISRKMLSTLYNPDLLQSFTAFCVKSPLISRILILNLDPKMAAELNEDEEEGSLLIINTKKLRKQWKVTTHILNSSMFILFIPVLVYLTTTYLVHF